MKLIKVQQRSNLLKPSLASTVCPFAGFATYDDCLPLLPPILTDSQ